MEMYERNLRQMRLTVWLVAALVFLIALFIYLLWLKRFMRNFDALKTGIIQLGEGHLETQIDQPLNVEEFENIRQEFESLVKEKKSIDAELADLVNKYKQVDDEVAQEELELKYEANARLLAVRKIFEEEQNQKKEKLSILDILNDDDVDIFN